MPRGLPVRVHDGRFARAIRVRSYAYRMACVPNRSVHMRIVHRLRDSLPKKPVGSVDHSASTLSWAQCCLGHGICPGVVPRNNVCRSLRQSRLRAFHFRGLTGLPQCFPLRRQGAKICMRISSHSLCACQVTCIFLRVKICVVGVFCLKTARKHNADADREVRLV